MDTKTYKRYEFIVRQFLSVEKPTAELLERFRAWLLDGRHCREKNVAVRKVFYEALSDPHDDSAGNEYPEKHLTPHKIS